eukprot:46938_1
MSSSKIPYHILFYDEKTEPYRDCQHKAYITDDSTYNDFINCIIKGLNKFESYHDIPKQIQRNRNNMIITIGAKAKQQPDIMKHKVTNHQIVQLNDIVNVPKHKCVYFIITKKKHNNTNTNTNTRTKTQNRNTNRKRNRKPLHNTNKMENNHSNTKLNAPQLKRRKKQQIIIKHSKKSGKNNKTLIKHELKHECLWILTDVTSLNDEYEQNVSGNKVKECIDDIINNNWVRQDCPTHYIALYSYGTDLIEETTVLNYSNENKTLILNRLNAIENIKSMSWANAMLQLINIIESKKDNIKCNHRIVLFCGKQCKARLNTMQKAIVKDIKCKLLTLNIIFDCIQISHSYRQNKEIAKVANRYWSSNHIGVVECADFMYPNKRNVSKTEAILIE